MTSLHLLAELHVLEFASRLKRQDEINENERARRRQSDIQRVRNPIANWRQYAINCAGPLCLLDAVGQAEESWVELFETAPRCQLPEPKPLPRGQLRFHRSFDGELHVDQSLNMA
jgi:hypothetical protein